MATGNRGKANNSLIGLKLEAGFAKQIPLKIVGTNSQSANLFEVRDISGNLLSGIGPAGLGSKTVASTATALGNSIIEDIGLTLSATGIVSGNGYALRSITTVSGTITGGAFVSGIRCGVRFSGTMNHADSRVAGLFVKLDDTGATETTGQMSVLWVDHGAGITGAHGGQFNMIRITDTVAGSKGNAIIYSYADASFVMDLDTDAGSPGWQAAAGSSSWGTTGGKAADGVFLFKYKGTTVYVPYMTSNA